MRGSSIGCAPVLRHHPCHAVSGRIAKRGIRRIFVDRFPYSIVFVQRDDEIEVLAFAHRKRRPGYWRNRLK